MPSFLSKVFGRKKDDTSPGRSSNSPASLLGGRYEAVSPTVSPSATRAQGFALNGQNGQNSHLGQQRAPHLSLRFPAREDGRVLLDDVFEGEVPRDVMLSEEVIGARRLSVDELLPLVQACAKFIHEKGSETLGLMHPHWYTSSPSLQRKLISLYLHPRTTDASTSSPPLSNFESEIEYSDPHDVASVLRWALRHFEPTDVPAFGMTSTDSGLYEWYNAFSTAERNHNYPMDAYDTLSSQSLIPTSHHQLLAVLLDLTFSLAAHAEANGVSGSKFSKLVGLWLLESKRKAAADDWRGFYADWDHAGRILEHVFLARIRSQATTLPKRLATLAAGYPYGPVETNGILTLLGKPRTSTRVYRALLITIDSELADKKGKPAAIPRRHPLLITTDALGAEPVKDEDKSAASEAWESAKAAAREDGAEATARAKLVFTEDTLNILSLVPLTNSTVPQSALTVKVLSSDAPSTSPRPVPEHRRSASVGGTTTGPSFDATSASASPSPKSPVDALLHSHSKATVTSSWTFTDWADFQSLGFSESTSTPDLAHTLRETDPDVEVTTPRPLVPSPLGLTLSRRSSGKRPTSPSGKKPMPRLSLDIPRDSGSGVTSSAASGITPVPRPATPPAEEVKPRTVAVAPVQLDEAFLDFWADALADPVSAAWPQFVLAQLRKPVVLRLTDDEGLTEREERVEWVVLERTFTRPTPKPRAPIPTYSPSAAVAAGEGFTLLPPSPTATGQKTGSSSGKNSVAPSPRPSIAGDRMSSTLSATKRRLGFFTRTLSGQDKKEKGEDKKKDKKDKEGSKKGKGKEDKDKGPTRVGEMGEIVHEDPEEEAKETNSNVNLGETAKAALVGAGAAVLSGVAAVTAAVGSSRQVDASEVPLPPDTPKVQNAEELDSRFVERFTPGHTPAPDWTPVEERSTKDVEPSVPAPVAALAEAEAAIGVHAVGPVDGMIGTEHGAHSAAASVVALAAGAVVDAQDAQSEEKEVPVPTLETTTTQAQDDRVDSVEAPATQSILSGHVFASVVPIAESAMAVAEKAKDIAPADLREAELGAVPGALASAISAVTTDAAAIVSSMQSKAEETMVGKKEEEHTQSSEPESELKSVANPVEDSITVPAEVSTKLSPVSGVLTSAISAVTTDATAFVSSMRSKAEDVMEGRKDEETIQPTAPESEPPVAITADVPITAPAPVASLESPSQSLAAPVLAEDAAVLEPVPEQTTPAPTVAPVVGELAQDLAIPVSTADESSVDPTTSAPEASSEPSSDAAEFGENPARTIQEVQAALASAPSTELIEEIKLVEQSMIDAALAEPSAQDHIEAKVSVAAPVVDAQDTEEAEDIEQVDEKVQLPETDTKVDPLEGAEPWETITGGAAVATAMEDSEASREDTKSPQAVVVFSSKLKPNEAVREIPNTEDLKTASELVPAHTSPALASSLGFSQTGDAASPVPQVEQTEDVPTVAAEDTPQDTLDVEEITLETPVAEKFRAEHLVDLPSSVVAPVTPAVEKLEEETERIVSAEEALKTIKDFPPQPEDETNPASEPVAKTQDYDDNAEGRQPQAVPTVTSPLHASVTDKAIDEETGTVEATVESDAQVKTSTGEQPFVALTFIAEEVPNDPHHPDMTLDEIKISKPVDTTSLETKLKSTNNAELSREDEALTLKDSSLETSDALASSHTEDPTALQEVIKAAAAAGATKEALHEIEVPGVESKPEDSVGDQPAVQEGDDEALVPEASLDEPLAPISEQTEAQEPVVDPKVEVVVDSAQMEKQPAQKPIVEEPVVEEPIAKEANNDVGIKDATTGEKPVVDEAVIDDVADASQEPTANAPAIEEVEVRDEQHASVEEEPVKPTVLEEADAEDSASTSKEQQPRNEFTAEASSSTAEETETTTTVGQEPATEIGPETEPDSRSAAETPALPSTGPPAEPEHSSSPPPHDNGAQQQQEAEPVPVPASEVSTVPASATTSADAQKLDALEEVGPVSAPQSPQAPAALEDVSSALHVASSAQSNSAAASRVQDNDQGANVVDEDSEFDMPTVLPPTNAPPADPTAEEPEVITEMVPVKSVAELAEEIADIADPGQDTKELKAKEDEVKKDMKAGDPEEEVEVREEVKAKDEPEHVDEHEYEHEHDDDEPASPASPTSPTTPATPTASSAKKTKKKKKGKK